MKFNNAVKTLSLLVCAGSCAGDRREIAKPAALPGIKRNKKKVILAQELNYPPYTSLSSEFEIAGFAPDFARGLEEVCQIKVVLVETQWNKCWVDSKTGIGDGLLNGHYHGCTAYTHTEGVRNRFLEFTKPILDLKPAGILTRLQDGIPVVDGQSALNGINVGDVVGWAPTADTLSIVKNKCNAENFLNYTLVAPPVPAGENANDVALRQLLNGTVDATWIYADQAKNYMDACKVNPIQSWDCDMWNKFGTDFAYVQTGIFDYVRAGTTLAISKKGSGLAQSLNPCIEDFIKTESYADLCVKYSLESACFANGFLNETVVTPPFIATSELTTSCADGYCPCPSSD